MASYSTLYINIVFKKETPSYITDFFHKGIVYDRVPKPFIDFGIASTTNLHVPDTMICTYEAKTFIENQPQNRYYLMILKEYELDQFYLTYGFIASLAQYAEDNALAGYIKSEFDTKVDLFAFKNEETLWSLHQKIDSKAEDNLNIFELEAIGHRIKHSEGTEDELNFLMDKFDKNVPKPNGSSLFFYPENKDVNIAEYNPSVEEVVRTCLDYKSINL